MSTDRTSTAGRPPSRRGRAGGALARRLVAAGAVAGAISSGAVVRAAELPATTIEAWERYVEATEARMRTELDGQAPFLWVDRLAEDERDEALLSRNGTRFRVYLQFFTQKVWTVVLNTEHDVEFLHVDDARLHVPSYARLIREVEHPDTPAEREKPEDNDRGTMWRFNNYCSFQAGPGRLHAVRVNHAHPRDPVPVERARAAVRERRAAREADVVAGSDAQTPGGVGHRVARG